MKRTQAWRAALAAVSLLAGLVALASVSTFAARGADRTSADRWCTRPPVITRLGKLKSSALTEVSGLAGGWRHPKVLYAHNDSGDSARFFALDLNGKRLGTHTFSGVEQTDWEDMASAPTTDGKGVLAFADIGDNTRSRESITVHRVAEPTDPAASGPVARVDAFVLRYPDGPRDAEAFTIGGDGSFWIVEKVLLQPAGVYRLAGGRPPGEYVLERVGEVPAAAGPITAMVGLVGVEDVVLRTLLGFELYAVGANPPIGGRSACRFRGPPERQGESVARLSDGRLVTIGEGKEAPVWAVRPG